MAKPIKSLELHYPMIQFLIIMLFIIIVKVSEQFMKFWENLCLFEWFEFLRIWRQLAICGNHRNYLLKLKLWKLNNAV